MMTLYLNNGSVWNITKDIEKKQVLFDGASTSSIVLSITGSTSKEILEAFKEPFNTREMGLFAENGVKMSSFIGYSKCKSVARDEITFDTNGIEVFIVTLVQPKDLSDIVATMENKLATLESTIQAFNTEPDASTMELTELKTFLIKKSSSALEKYLDLHPITSTCHGGISKEYSITSDKQQYLNQAIALATIAVQNGDETYKISWNARGEECTYDWTVSEMIELAFEINQVVRPLISKQQSIETLINASVTTSEALTVEIKYE